MGKPITDERLNKLRNKTFRDAGLIQELVSRIDHSEGRIKELEGRLEYALTHTTLVTIDLGMYQLIDGQGDSMWIGQEGGEGMQTTKMKLGQCIAAYYVENF